jgi:hypothetical protein
MSSSTSKLSVPAVRKKMPGELTEPQRTTLTALADILCGPNDRVAPPSEQSEFAQWLEVALAARSDSFDLLLALTDQAAESNDPAGWLRTLHDTDAGSFQVLSAVLAGAYLLVPDVKSAVGYPGQRRDPAGLEEAVDQISDGILEPVLERGHFFVATPGGQ